MSKADQVVAAITGLDHPSDPVAVAKVTREFPIRDVAAAAATLPASGGSQPILFTSVPVTSAALLGITGSDATWPVLLPALGGRLYYVLHHVVLHYRAATPYDASAVFDLYNSDSSAAWSPTAGLPLDLSAVTDQYVDTFLGLLPVGSYAAAVVEDQPVKLFVRATPTSGTGTLTARLWYSEIDGAP